MTNTTKDTFAFSTLSDLAIFYPWSNSAYTTLSSNSTWTSSGSTLLSTMSTARSPSHSANQLCQSGLTNTATFTSLISTYQSVFMTNYIIVSTNGSSSSRKKRAVTNTFTCTTLTSIGSPAISSLTAAQLSTLSSGEFYSCETLLGYSANAWSSSQLTALVALAKTYFGTSANISETDIVALNYIITGFAGTNSFTTSDLSTLVFSTSSQTSASISALGALSGWSSAQLTALNTPITNFITNALGGTITSSFMAYASNLLCALTTAQINAIPTSAFTISALSKISISCPNIGTWYAYAKANISAYSNPASSASSLSEMGSVIAGITPADIATISTDNIGSVTSSAWTNMPVATVNSLSSTQVASLSHDQATSLLSNPNAASFSSSITSALNSILGSPSSTTSASDRNQSISFVSFVISLMLALFSANL